MTEFIDKLGIKHHLDFPDFRPNVALYRCLETPASSEVRPVFSTFLGGYKSKHSVMDQVVS